MYEGPAEIGRVATMAPMNGPARSTILDAATTMMAVVSIVAARRSQKEWGMAPGR